MGTQVEAGLGPDGRPVAIKRAAGPVATGRLEREAALLATIQHRGVVETTGFERDGDDATLTTRWVTGGPLRTAIEQGRNRTALLAALADAAATIADLHEHSITHGRVDATHVLLSGDGGAVLCGFADAGDAAAPGADVAAIGALIRDVAAMPASKSSRPLLGARGVDEVSLKLAIERANDPESARHLPARALADLLAGVLPPSPAAQTRVVAPRHGPPESASRTRRDRARLAAAWIISITGLLVAMAFVVPALLSRSRARPTAPGLNTTSSAVGATTSASNPIVPTIGAAQRLWPSSCPSVTSAVKADIDGDGCTDDIAINGATVTASGHRYKLDTEPSDVVAIGDWDCDGIATAAVLHETTGAVDVFDAWPTTVQRSVTAHRVGTYADATALAARPTANGCAALVVTAVDGDHAVTS